MENKEAFIQFSTGQLSKILKLPTQDAREMTNYILSITEESAAVKYLNVWKVGSTSYQNNLSRIS
jgi:hypothetical protein